MQYPNFFRNQLTALFAITVFCYPPINAKEYKPLFDGKTFAGWEGDTGKVWRIESGEIIAGTPGAKQPRNEFLATVRSYTDFELSLEYKRGANNGGVQFRSERVPNHHEMIGYQADFAPGIDGFLYDESRRKRFLAIYDPETGPALAKPEGTSEAIKRAVHMSQESAKKLMLDEWNRYKIRVEGSHIQLWVNDVKTVDYTEAEPGIPTTGKIAIQIHGGATEIRYRNIFIEELNDSKPKTERAGQSFQLKTGETIALLGGSNIERTRFNAELQTQLIASQPSLRLHVRNFGWEGDTVFEQWRDGGVSKQPPSKQQVPGVGAEQNQNWRQQRDWNQQLSEAGVTTVIAQFGQMEALAGVENLPMFIESYRILIAELGSGGRRVVLLSPTRFEKPLEPLWPDLSLRNQSLEAYSKAIQKLATELGLLFVDLADADNSKKLTSNGYQLNETGQTVVARTITAKLGLEVRSEKEVEGARLEVVQMERLWFDYWRPMNWAFLQGDRTNVPYSKDWKDSSKRIFPQEMEDFRPLLQQADENIWLALEGKPTHPIRERSSIPTEPPSAPAQSPEEELASFNILPGFEVNLFASEADGIVKPIQMRWDERGRLWVACAKSYPQIKPGEKPDDYVLICEDTNDDGRADKFTKFADGLFMPSGIELGDGGLYVAQGTELLHLKDIDGDGKADSRRIVLGGFGTADSHQMINCLNWGFGGELWFTQGHHIYSRVETPYGVETLNRAGVWRFRPRTGHLDPFFQWSSAGANCWGVVTTDYGQPFHKSGANIGAYYSTPGLVRSSLAVNSQAMNLFLARIKQVGMDFVGSAHFPAEMQGRAIIGGYYANVLEQHELILRDGMYESKQLPNIIETKNSVFRPVEVRGGPDGAIYVADWYNPIIGHYQASYRHPDRDKAHGRIWRVTSKDRPLVRKADLIKKTVAELLEQLDSPERWVQYQVKRLLFEKNTSEVSEALDIWVSQNGDNDYRRLQALSVFEAHELPRLKLLKELLLVADPRIRAYATRALSTWARSAAIPEALQLIERQIQDADPLVRLEAIVAASYIRDPRTAVVASKALNHPFNSYHHHALTKMLNATHAMWAPLVSEGMLDFEKDEHLIFALQNGWVENNPGDLKALSGAPVAYNPSTNMKAKQIVRRNADLHASDPRRAAIWLKAMAATATPLELPYIFELAGNDPEVLAALKCAAPAQAESILEPLLNSHSEALKEQGLRLAGQWRVKAFEERVRSIAFDENAAPGLRKTAISALSNADDLKKLAQHPAIGRIALHTLVGNNPGIATKFVLADVNHAQTPDAAATMLGPLLDRSEGLPALISALGQPESLSPGAARIAMKALNSIGRSDARISQLLMKLAGINTSLPAYTKEYVSSVAKSAASFGSAIEGKKIYEQAGCVACHVPGPNGSKVGPDLSSISRGMPIDMIIAEVVWPALNVKEGYEAATVTLKDGSVVSGFKHTDTADSITVREMSSGELRTIRKSDARTVQVGGTVMPDGLTAGMSEQQLAHLVRYLSELGQ